MIGSSPIHLGPKDEGRVTTPQVVAANVIGPFWNFAVYSYSSAGITLTSRAGDVILTDLMGLDVSIAWGDIGSLAVQTGARSLGYLATRRRCLSGSR